MPGFFLDIANPELLRILNINYDIFRSFYYYSFLLTMSTYMKIQSTAQSPNAFSTELSEIKTFILTYDVLNLATIFFSSIYISSSLNFSATTVQFFIFIGFLKSFGIFFVAYLQKYDATSSDISTVISIQTLVGTITCQ